MKIDRILSVIAIVLALTAVFLSIGLLRSSPYGKPLDEYDLSDPKAALFSLQEMIRRQDIRAGVSYFLGLMAIDDKEGKFAFFSDEITDVKFIKTFDIKDSGYDSNNGKVVSFITYKVKGVEKRQVFYFVQHNGRFFPAGDYSLPYSEESRSSADKRYNAMIQSFIETGKVE